MSLELVPDGVVRLDRHGVIREMNEAAAELTGFAPKRQVGRSCNEVLHPRTVAGVPLLEGGWPSWAILPGVQKLPEQSVVLRTEDGGDVPVRLTGRVRRDDRGQVEEVVLAFRPHQSRASGNDPTGIAVVSTVSHELRSPLTAIKGYTSLLASRWDTFSDDDKKMMLAQIGHGAQRVTRLITELLEVSRIEGGNLPLQRQLVDVPPLVKQVVQALKTEFPELDPQISFPAISPRVFLDPEKFEQVITNLMENACKYASPTGIRITGTFEDERMTITVEDTGEGIEPTELPRLFSKFYRGVNTKPSGSGLGLWISRGIVEAHGGELVVQSSVGAGSRFTVILPLDDEEAT